MLVRNLEGFKKNLAQGKELILPDPAQIVFTPLSNQAFTEKPDRPRLCDLKQITSPISLIPHI